MSEQYWSNFGAMSVDDYVATHIDNSADELARRQQTLALLPAGVRSLLDVGCGFGHFLALAQQRGITGQGLEVAAVKVEYARRALGLDVQVGSIAALPHGDRSVDAVSALEVVEHLPLALYQAGLAELARVARDWVLISVPWQEQRRNAGCPSCGCEFNPWYHLRSYHDADFPGLLPGFRLAALQSLGQQQTLWPALARLRNRRAGPMPPLSTCPACGFARGAAGSAAAAPVTATVPPLRRLATTLLSRPAPRWYLALYQRDAAG